MLQLCLTVVEFRTIMFGTMYLQAGIINVGNSIVDQFF